MEKINYNFTEGQRVTKDHLNGIVGKVNDVIDYAGDESALASHVMPTGGVYESVDLGLPSGTKWARRNVGANSETEYGDLFAWGATEPYRMNGSTVYDNTDNYGASKAAQIQHDLSPHQDAATVHMGAGWRMPTRAQFDELQANTDMEWTSIGGVNGRKFMKKGDHSVYVFFPASGGVNGSSLSYRSIDGYYWSRTFHSSSSAWRLLFYSSDMYSYTYDRSNGFNVRGVRF